MHTMHGTRDKSLVGDVFNMKKFMIYLEAVLVVSIVSMLIRAGIRGLKYTWGDSAIIAGATVVVVRIYFFIADRIRKK